MPPPGFFRGPPMELLVTELLFFFIVCTLCIIIYFKTNGIYQLTKHKGILHFQNIFLFFALAYLFRLIFLLVFLTAGITEIRPRSLQHWIFPSVGFFSTMAILSLVATLVTRRMKKADNLHYWIVGIALVSSIVMFLTRSYKELVFIQTLVFLAAIVFVFYQPKKKGKHSFITQNNVTYLLLFVFWILSVIAFDKRLIPYEYKIPLYILSAAVFFWIYIRVHKRLASHA